MRIVAIDTATPASSVAIGEDDALLGLSVNVDRRGHVGFLVPAIDFVLGRAGRKPRDIDLVAVDIGPGPYTGLRAGIATAQALFVADTNELDGERVEPHHFGGDRVDGHLV